MTLIYAFLIAGAICALTQLLADLKIPFPLVALLLMAIGGGICTKLGIYDFLSSFSVGGPAVTALGCGNGAFSAGVALITAGNPMPLILTVLLNLILVGMGAACGSILLKKFPEMF